MTAKRLTFVLCRCRAHGTFRNSEGTEGPDVASKEAALHQLDDAIAYRIIGTAEALALMHAVQSSAMAPRERDVPPPLMDKVRDWERMRAATNGPLPCSSFHELLDDIRPV